MSGMRILGIVGMVVGVLIGCGGLALGILALLGYGKCGCRDFIPLTISCSLSSVALYLGGVRLLCKGLKPGA